jgi:hypothetical protein
VGLGRPGKHQTKTNAKTEKRVPVEVRIGVQHVAREITFETALSADELTKAVREALTGELLELTDDKGGRIIVPSATIGYVSTGAERRGGVGFGAG